MMTKNEPKRYETLIFLILFLGFFTIFGTIMGLSNMLNTMMNTAYELLMGTCFYLMAVAVLAGAISALFSEYGVVELLNKVLSPLMTPLFGMPGASALGVVTTYLSDNPAIIALAKDHNFRSCFKDYQVPALTNLGTAFGMGLITTTFILSQASVLGSRVALAAICGNLGAIAGSIISTRLMLRHTKKVLGTELNSSAVIENENKETEKKSGFVRFMDALTSGGKAGVDLGLAIIPGVLIICTFVMMLTYGENPAGGYTGGAYEGIAFLPAAANKLKFLLTPLFGFKDGSSISVLITAVGSSGASLGLIPNLIKDGYATVGDLAVFNAVCMCWSGYLSTHVSMMDALGYNRFTGNAIAYHTIGGLAAGVVAHWLFVLISIVL